MLKRETRTFSPAGWTGSWSAWCPDGWSRTRVCASRLWVDDKRTDAPPRNSASQRRPTDSKGHFMTNLTNQHEDQVQTHRTSSFCLPQRPDAPRRAWRSPRGGPSWSSTSPPSHFLYPWYTEHVSACLLNDQKTGLLCFFILEWMSLTRRRLNTGALRRSAPGDSLGSDAWGQTSLSSRHSSGLLRDTRSWTYLDAGRVERSTFYRWIIIFPTALEIFFKSYQAVK